MRPHGSFMMLLARMNCLSKSPIETRDGLVFWIFKGRKGLHEDMGIKDLRKVLQNEQIDTHCYSLDESEPITLEIVYCIRYSADGYEVSINERGRFVDRRIFPDETSACCAFLNLMGKYHNECLRKYALA